MRAGRETKAPWPLRILFGMLALGFVYSFGSIKYQSNTIGVVFGPLVLWFIAFECTHVAVIGRWYGAKELRRALNIKTKNGALSDEQ